MKALVMKCTAVLALAAVLVLAAEPAAKPAPPPHLAFQKEAAAILPAFRKWGRTTGREVEMLDADGKVVGYLRLAPAGRRSRMRGFKGNVDVAAVLGPDKRILGMALGANRETPRFLQKVRAGGLLGRYNGKTVKEANAAPAPMPVTGATYSSRAIIAEMKDVLK
jgi:Na+-translocating ferredoxin:NAD+ oxidoreductase RnfG subunit